MNFIKDFVLYDQVPSFNFDKLYSIDQNLISIPLILKSKYYGNSSLVYLLSLFQTFQNLENYSEKNKVGFVSYSHSLTTLILRSLEKHEIIKIISCEKSNTCDLSIHYNQLGNTNKKDKIKMYKLYFIKLRSFNKEDIAYIYTLIKFFKLPEDIFIIKEINEKIYLKANYKKIKEYIEDGTFSNDFSIFEYLKNLIIYLDDDSFDNPFTELRRKWKE